MTDITNIVSIVVVLIFAILTSFVVPWLKTKIDAQKLDKIIRWVRIAVEAAEQIYSESGMGEKKKDYVLNFLNGKGYTLDSDQINNLIESEVHKLR